MSKHVLTIVIGFLVGYNGMSGIINGLVSHDIVGFVAGASLIVAWIAYLLKYHSKETNE